MSDAGALPDQGQTDDPLTNDVHYAGNVYYIDSINGNDNNTGLSPDQAWKTLAKASSKFSVGEWDTKAPNSHTNPPYHEPWTAAPSGSAFLFMRGGTYTGHIGVSPMKTGSWTFEDNYTFGAYGDATAPRPVIVNDHTAAVSTSGQITGQQFSVRNLHLVDGPGTVATGLKLNGTDGVTVYNTVVEGFDQSGILADDTSNLTIENTTLYDNRVSYGGGFAGGGSNLKILHSSFIDNGSNGLLSHNTYLRYLSNALIEGNLFAGGGNLGLVVHGTSDGVIIRGNEFYGNNNGLDISPHGSVIQANEVFNNFLIENNIIHGNGFKPSQQGYGMMLQSLTNAVIRDNLIYDNRLGALSISDALPTDQQSANVRFYNNLLSGLVNILGLLTTDLLFENNIFTNKGGGADSFALKVALGFSDAELTLDHNLYFMPDKANGKVVSYHNVASTLSTLAALFGQELHGLNTDPQFVDPSGQNYTLQETSPAIDAGLTIAGDVADLAGTPRPQGNGTDIGPYEFIEHVSAPAPAPTTITLMDDTGTPGDGVTRDAAITLAGIADVNTALVHIFDLFDWLGSATVNSDGTWSFATTALLDGLHNFVAVSEGNGTLSAPSPLDVTVDTIAPAAPLITSLFNQSAGADNTLTLAGTAEAGSIVTVYDGPALFGSTTADANGAWTFTSAPLINGLHNLTAVAADIAANTSPASIALLAGSGGADTIKGGGANDILYGFDGDDRLEGGAGADTATGGAGNDTYIVDSLNDVVIENPGEGTDTVQTKVSNYVLPGNVENLTLLGITSGFGNSANNFILGSSGNNMLTGGGGADTIDGGGGIDTAIYSASAAAVNVSLATGLGYGGDAEGDVLLNVERIVGSAFDDTLEGNGGDNQLSGAGGINTVTYEHAAGGVTVTIAGTAAQNTIGAGIDILEGFRNLTGSAFNDTLTGNQLDNVLMGGAGNDTLAGNSGGDTLNGGEGNDTASYASSAAKVRVNLATGLGLDGDAQGDRLNSIENVIGSAFADLLAGDGAANVLTGGAGNDTLDGGAGADTTTGGAGNDTYIVDSLSDVVAEIAGEGTDTVQAKVSGFVLSENVENLTLMSVTSGTGNSGNNVILGSSGNNMLAGMGGADTIDGGAGVDTAIYAASAAGVNVSLATGLGFGGDAEGDVLTNIERITGSAFDDTLEGSSGDNQLTGGAGINTVSYEHAAAGVTVTIAGTAAQNTIGAGIDILENFKNLTGSAFDDTLTGNQLDNVLIGGAGNDTLAGNSGNDTLRGGSGSNKFSFGANFGKDTITDFKLGEDKVLLTQSIFPQASKIAAAISDDGFGNARFTVNGANTITFLGISATDLKQHTDDFQIV